MRAWIFYLAYAIAAGSCEDVFEYSPNQVFDDDTAIGLNEKNLDSLRAAPVDDTITIAFIGDSQRFYDEVDEFIEKANSISSIDFTILAGDITDFGLLEEFELINDRLSKLRKPYIAVIGNHDVLAKGEETFERMFGPLNFSFVYDSVKFIVHNTNGREYPTGKVPDMNWLREELSADDHHVRYHVALSHIPPFDNDFDKTLEQAYTETLNGKKSLLVSLHGHIHEHKDGYPYNDHVRYITSHSFDKRSFVLLQIVNGQIVKTIIDY